jgi:hypothetical protein
MRGRGGVGTVVADAPAALAEVAGSVGPRTDVVAVLLAVGPYASIPCDLPWRTDPAIASAADRTRTPLPGDAG